MSGMVDPLADSLAALEASLNPASPGIIRTQPVDARLAALKTAASFTPVTQMEDPLGVDLSALGGAGNSNPVVALSSTNGVAASDGAGRTAITFNADDVLLSSIPFVADVLIVGGGAGGGLGAGGPAGRFRYLRNVQFGTQTPIQVGLGGAGLATFGLKGNPGGNSAVWLNTGPLVAAGGQPVNILSTNALQWRSGSGAGVASASTSNTYTIAPGEGVDGTNAGGTVTTFASPFPAAGSGGSGGPGGDATVVGHAGTAGPGTQCSITGTALFYAAAGGSTCFSNGGSGSTPTSGGSGIGGDGAGTNGIGGNGLDGTGSGGGGGYNTGQSGKGGRGVVIVLPLSTNASHGTKTIAPSASAIVLSNTTNLAAFASVVRVSTWNGNCLQVKRASDSTTLDIGFVNNVVDWASVDAFGVNTAITVTKYYDQTGNGNDLIGSGSGSVGLPTFSGLNSWFGIRPVSIQGIGNTQHQEFKCATLTGNTNAVTIYQVAAPRTSTDFQGYWQLTDAAQTTFYSSLYHNAGTSLLCKPQGVSAIATGFYPRVAPGTISMSSSGSAGQIVRVNGSQFTSASNTLSQAFAGIIVGQGNSGTYFGEFDLFAMAVYTAAHNAAAMVTVESDMSAPFSLQSSFTNRVVYGGNSLVYGQQSTMNQQATWQAGFGKSTNGPIPTWEAFSMGVAARTVATEYASVKSVYASLYDATKLYNVVVLSDATNDATGYTFTSQAQAEAQADTDWAGIYVPFVAYLKAGGGGGVAFDRVVIPTIDARGAITTANWKEYYRLRMNINIRTNAASIGAVVSDRAAAGPGGATDTQAVMSSDTNISPDSTHFSIRGYSYLMQPDRTAITGYTQPIAA